MTSNLTKYLHSLIKTFSIVVKQLQTFSDNNNFTKILDSCHIPPWQSLDFRNSHDLMIMKPSFKHLHFIKSRNLADKTGHFKFFFHHFGLGLCSGSSWLNQLGMKKWGFFVVETYNFYLIIYATLLKLWR